MAVSLAHFGLPADYVTWLPDNDLGNACIQYLPQYGVGVDKAVVAKAVVTACAASGVRVVEFTNRGDFAYQVFSERSRYFSQVDPKVILELAASPRSQKLRTGGRE